MKKIRFIWFVDRNNIDRLRIEVGKDAKKALRYSRNI